MYKTESPQYMSILYYTFCSGQEVYDTLFNWHVLLY